MVVLAAIGGTIALGVITVEIRITWLGIATRRRLLATGAVEIGVMETMEEAILVISVANLVTLLGIVGRIMKSALLVVAAAAILAISVVNLVTLLGIARAIMKSVVVVVVQGSAITVESLGTLLGIVEYPDLDLVVVIATPVAVLDI